MIIQNMQKIMLVGCFLCLCGGMEAQSKKEIKKHGIVSVTITETTGGKTLTDEITTYDAKGEEIEKSEYTKEGVLKKTTKNKLNNLGDVIEEEEYDEKNNLKQKTLIKYNALGDKKEELIYDANKKLIKKHVYVYDNKGLKTERKTLDPAGKLVSTKKYAYTFQ